MFENGVFGNLPEGLAKLLMFSERVFLVKFDQNSVVLDCSDSLRKILTVPEAPIGRKFEEIFLPVGDLSQRVCLNDLIVGEKPEPILVRLIMSGRPCRLIAVKEPGQVTCWGEVIGDRSSAGLNEMSGLTGQIQGLLTQVRRQHEQLQRDIRTAAWLQQKFLPGTRQFEGAQIAWKFQPCENIGGDFFNVFSFHDETLAAYLLDVSGHGVSAAMMGVAVVQALQQLVGFLETKATKRRSMHDLIVRLEEEFPIERFSLYFTLVYLEIDPARRKMSWINAGHPRPVLFREKMQPFFLDGAGPFIGLNKIDLIQENQIELRTGDSLFLYSDGVTGRRSLTGETFGNERLKNSLHGNHQPQSIQEIVDRISDANDLFAGFKTADDDLTLLGITLT
ncbi:MAG: PP2C family protein-serine/threonine phosphatase [Candidatus Riflebacteria bacterium]